MIIGHNDDVLTQILLFLPAKSVIRFKLVCKRWFCLISGHYFSHLHTLQHSIIKAESPSLILHLQNTNQYYHLNYTLHSANLVQYYFPVHIVDPTVCSFSNGLFLLKCNVSSEISPQECHIYNPATRQSKKILLNGHNRYTVVMGLNLAFDYVKSHHYKIVCVRAAARRRISGSMFSGLWRFYLIEIYDSETCTWSICGEQFSAPRNMDFSRGVYWNGGIQWNGMFYDFLLNTVLENSDYILDGNYVEWSGCLHCISHSPPKDMIKVYEMQSDCNSLLSKYEVSLDVDSEPLSVLSIVKGDTEEDSSLLVHTPGKIMTYVIHNRSFNEVVDFEDEEFCDTSCVQFVSRSVFQFAATLTPV